MQYTDCRHDKDLCCLLLDSEPNGSVLSCNHVSVCAAVYFLDSSVDHCKVVEVQICCVTVLCRQI